jgi:transcriptional regulator with XRE-family HTH domain
MNVEDLFAEIEASDPEFRARWALDEPRFRVGSNLYRLRTTRGWTRQDLARAAGLRERGIARIERGDANPRLDALTRLAIALGVSHADFFQAQAS